MSERATANRILFINTFAFTVCFAVWTMYGVLVTFLVDHRIVQLDKAQIGWLIGIPILTGSLFRLPAGLLTDRHGGKPVYIAVLLVSAAGAALTSLATTFWGLMFAGLAFGISGTAFAVGIAYSSVWFPKEKQGTALGIFGVGNAGAGITSLCAPLLLKWLTDGGQDLDKWRIMPLIYAGSLVVTAIIFALTTQNRKVEGASERTMTDMLYPLRDIRVWRFGLYYFLVFGAFVALAQWLIPYYLNVYGMTLAMAGLMASIFSLPSGFIRALGGWISDTVGARATMYWVLSTCALFFILLIMPRMEITSPGQGVMADRPGTVTSVTSQKITVDDVEYPLKVRKNSLTPEDDSTLVWPTFQSWQEPNVQVGQRVKRREILAKGVTHIYFQANVWIFTALVFLAGISMGVGKAAVYKHIPDYFPRDVGVVGGLVGVLGGLGGFFCPILFGYLVRATGVWTTCWLFLAVITIISLVWMHLVILKMTRGMTPRGILDEPRDEPMSQGRAGAAQES